MKKILTLSLALSVCGAASADKFELLTCGLPQEEVMGLQMTGLGLSANGKYACGSAVMGYAYFLADLEKNELTYVESDEDGAQLRHVSNNGVAIGFNGPGVTYSITGEEKVLKAPEGYNYILGEDITDDGSLLVGSMIPRGYSNFAAAYSHDGVEWTKLPQPTEEELGPYAGRGMTAKLVDGAGKVIAGTIGDNVGPAILWIRNEAGDYQIDPLFSKYVVMSEDEIAAGVKELGTLIPMDVSDNGKYVALQGRLLSGEYVPVIYDVETQTLNINKEPQPIDEYGLGLTPMAITDDGTIIGIIGSMPMYLASGSFIIKGGQTRAEAFSQVYPEFAKVMSYPESIGFNVPTGISADGRFILGYAFYSPDFFDEESPAYYVTYIIDTETGSGIDEVTAGAETEAVPVAYYDLQGRRMNGMTEGVNIVRMSDGSVKKVMR